MKDQLFRIILKGTVREGYDLESVLENLARLFQRDKEKIRGLLTGSPISIGAAVDEVKARKYKLAIEKSGAACSIAPVPQEAKPGKPAGAAEGVEGQTLEAPGTTCPKCGYAPSRATDLSIVQGECPKCGHVAGKAGGPAKAGESAAPDFTDTVTLMVDGVAQDRPLASWGRRMLATAHTFSLFIIVYSVLLVTVVLLLAPRDYVLRMLFREFIFTAMNLYPAVITVLSMIMVCTIVPLLNEGRTLGQSIVGIDLLDVQGDRPGDMYLSLTLRTVAVGFLTFLPGLLLNWIGSNLGLVGSYWETVLLMVGMAGVSWFVSGIVSLASTEGRGLVDLCSRTIQTHQGSLTQNTVLTALAPFVAVLTLFLVFGFVVPFLWIR